jgi:hypothetical protein
MNFLALRWSRSPLFGSRRDLDILDIQSIDAFFSHLGLSIYFFTFINCPFGRCSSRTCCHDRSLSIAPCNTFTEDRLSIAIIDGEVVHLPFRKFSHPHFLGLFALYNLSEGAAAAFDLPLFFFLPFPFLNILIDRLSVLLRGHSSILRMCVSSVWLS